jgi:hypothetical protein
MGKSFNKLVEDKKQNHFRVLEKDGKLIKRTFGTKYSYTDQPLEEDPYLYALNMGLEENTH